MDIYIQQPACGGYIQASYIGSQKMVDFFIKTKIQQKCI